MTFCLDRIPTMTSGLFSTPAQNSDKVVGLWTSRPIREPEGTLGLEKGLDPTMGRDADMQRDDVFDRGLLGKIARTGDIVDGGKISRSGLGLCAHSPMSCGVC